MYRIVIKPEHFTEYYKSLVSCAELAKKFYESKMELELGFAIEELLKILGVENSTVKKRNGGEGR